MVNFGGFGIDLVLEDLGWMGAEGLGFVADFAFDEAFFEEFAGIVVDGGAGKVEGFGEVNDGLGWFMDQVEVEVDFDGGEVEFGEE